MRLSGSIAPAIKHHPLTGMAIEPLWVRPDGKVCWPMMGGAPDDDEDKDKDGDDDGDSGADDDDDDGDDGDGSDDSNKDTISKAEFEALRKRMKAADKRAALAEKKVKEAEDAKKDDLTRASDELTTAQDRIKELEQSLQSLRLSNTFLTANKHSWHDPDDALDVAQRKGYLEDVVDEESGEVDKKALGAALDRLAKDKPYLVKPKSGKDADDDKDTKQQPSGHGGPKRSGNNKDEDAKRAERRKRFPVLQNR
jgi:hypothetical protein